MRYIALEEAFSIPELTGRQPPPWPANRFSQRHLADWARKLPDFTEYRLPEMDAAGIDVQVLSLTVPGLQADVDPAAARDDARFANDYLAKVVAGHPDRFRGFAALPMQDPQAAAAELGRCVRELGFCGALVNDHLQGHYLDEPRYDEVWAALEELSVPLYLHPGAPPAALTGAVLEIGADAITFSVDYPYESSHQAVAGLERTTLTATDRDKIAHGNAERLLRL
jgi:2,3-dihydroxybenzoate decarboxylase